MRERERYHGGFSGVRALKNEKEERGERERWWDYWEDDGSLNVGRREISWAIFRRREKCGEERDFRGRKQGLRVVLAL